MTATSTPGASEVGLIKSVYARLEGERGKQLRDVVNVARGKTGAGKGCENKETAGEERRK